jgi:tetratricopeptide (TPR) repeat protein
MNFDILLTRAEKARDSSRFAEAEGIFRKLLVHPSLDKSDKAQALLGLADMERIQGYFSGALQHYQKASQLLKKENQEAYWDAQVGWALAARACGRPKEALAILKKALAAYRRQRDSQGEAFTHWALGGTLRIAGQMNEGLKELQTALKMFKSLKDDEGISYICCALGGIFRMLGRYAESGKFYREANRRMRRREDTFGIAYSYCGLGNVERMAGRFKQALPFYRKAEKLYGTIGDRVSYAYTLWSIGTTHKMLGQYAQAHWAFYKADNLFKKTGDTRGRIYTLLGFAEIEHLKNRFHKSLLNYWRPAEKLADKNDFLWERLHVKTFLPMTLWEPMKSLAQTIGPKSLGPRKKKFEAIHQSVLLKRKKEYQKLGSEFYPQSIPVNWP